MISFLVPISSKADVFNPLNDELNPICHLLALLGAHHILHVSRMRVKICTLNVTVAHNIPQQNLSQVISQGLFHLVSRHTYVSEGYWLRIRHRQQQILKLCN